MGFDGVGIVSGTGNAILGNSIHSNGGPGIQLDTVAVTPNDTDDADTAWGEAGVGAVFIFTGGHSAFVEYRQRFGHDFLQERLLSVGWRMELP